MNDHMPGMGEHPLNALTEQASPEEKKKAAAAHAEGQRAVRTFEGDIAEAVAERNASTASMVMAEQEKAGQGGDGPRTPSNAGKKLLIAIISIVLVAAGIGGGYYLYLKSPLALTAPAARKPTALPSIVAPDSQAVVDVSGLSKNGIRSAVENSLGQAKGPAGTIDQIIPVQDNGSSTVLMSGPDFLTTASITAPDILARSLNADWMLGTYADESGAAGPFIILTDGFFQNAYAGMISWEKDMPDSLATIFPIETGETPATSSLLTYFSISGSWSDGVIENKDVRIFSAPDGTVLLLYSFVNNGTIVITTDENALAEIIKRLESQTFTR